MDKPPKLSDIFLDDGNIALVTPELRFMQPDGKFWNPVNVNGADLRFLNRLLVGPSQSPLGAIARAALGTKGAPTGMTVEGTPERVGLPGYGGSSPSSGDVTYYPHGPVSPAFIKLKRMKPPYDLFELLDAMREAILDLQRRLG